MTNPIPNSPKIPNPNSTSHQSPHTPHPFFCPTTPPHSDYSPFPKKLKNQQTQTKQNKKNLFLCFSFLSFSLSFLPCLFPRITQIPSRKKLGFFPAKRNNGIPRKQHELALRLRLDRRYPCPRCQFLCSKPGFHLARTGLEWFF